MSQELIYTSVPQGLKPGSKGFCTVAMTAGMPVALVERLESLSGYRAIFPLGDPNSSKNPIIYAHWRVSVAGKTRSVLSRVAFAGVDYSQRSNKFAHHLVLDSAEETVAGPAWLLTQPGLMLSQWSQSPMLLQTSRPIPDADRPARPCTAWAAATGDAGWAGVLAEAYLQDPTKPAYLVYPPGVDILPLVEEALALLPPEMRWRVTFSTYFTDLPLGLTCAWRGVATGTPAAKDAVRAKGRVFQIVSATTRCAPDSPIVAQARTGQYSPAARHQGFVPASDKSGQFPLTEEGDDTTLPQKVAEVSQVASSAHRRRLSATPQDLVEEAFAEESPSNPYSVRAVAPPLRRGVPSWLAVVIGVACLGIGAIGGVYLSIRTRPQTADTVMTLSPSPLPPSATSQPAGTNANVDQDKQRLLKRASEIADISNIVGQGEPPANTGTPAPIKTPAPPANISGPGKKAESPKLPPVSEPPVIPADYAGIDITDLPLQRALTGFPLTQRLEPVTGIPPGAARIDVVFPTNATIFQSCYGSWRLTTEPNERNKSVVLVVTSAKTNATLLPNARPKSLTVCIIKLDERGVVITADASTDNAVAESFKVLDMSTLMVSDATGVHKHFFQWPIELRLNSPAGPVPLLSAQVEPYKVLAVDGSKLSGWSHGEDGRMNDLKFVLKSNPDVGFWISLLSPAGKTEQFEISKRIKCSWTVPPREIKQRADTAAQQLAQANNALKAAQARKANNVDKLQTKADEAKATADKWIETDREVQALGALNVKLKLRNGITLAEFPFSPSSSEETRGGEDLFSAQK